MLYYKPVFNPHVRAELVQLYADLETVASTLFTQIDTRLKSHQKTAILHDFEQSHHLLEQYGII